MNLLLVFVSVWLYHVSNRLMCVKMYVQVAYSVLGTRHFKAVNKPCAQQFM
jgi:hypothetical protein